MDYTKFWDWVRNISKNNFVFISEQNAPEDFKIVWEQEATRTINKKNDFKTVERLFIHQEGKSNKYFKY
jgi:DNA adenine methylase